MGRWDALFSPPHRFFYAGVFARPFYFSTKPASSVVSFGFFRSEFCLCWLKRTEIYLIIAIACVSFLFLSS
ncbi:hypothetical protein EJ06DRAFT_384121 [Trichodelitschia bisporula]|uniref:Uncharacterized protein n=1 Tax=Trichodelitschia bisporula TaxID=703511 RepID=A0A6G1HZ04_9PEZI|nr:hypothetical protein EJ06DRAFT_384121 [Trichodelitschia bisporula]